MSSQTSDKIVEAGSPELIRSIRKKLKDHTAFAERINDARQRNNATLRHLILEENRIDLLAEHVLGYDPQQIHYEMLAFQQNHQEGMVLAWRGAAKTTFCNITYVIFKILQNPNIRVLLASNAIDQARVFLKSIKLHFETNERLIEIFGDFYMGARSWTETDIIVPQRTSFAGESTVLCTGMGTSLPSRHFDLILVDDLVIRSNAQTEAQRKKTHQYFYETLYPTLESPYGELWVLGTRWHDEDLYGHFAEQDYKDHHIIISVFDEEDDSRWPEKYPKERMEKIRKANPEAFELQYMCTTGASLGEIFTLEHFDFYDELPADLVLWQGVDLAIGTAARNDFLAHVTIGVQRSTKDVYLVSYRMAKMPFPKQVRLIASRYDEYPDTLRVVIETNAYQVAMVQQLKQDYPDMPVIGRQTKSDKETRAQKRAYQFTDRPLLVHRGQGAFIKMLRSFPNKKGSKDLFDALDIVLDPALKGVRKKRRQVPGLI